MDSDYLNNIKSNCGVDFTPIGKNSLITVSDNKLEVSETNCYTLIFKINYKNGLPSEISVAYLLGGYKYSFIIINEKPQKSTVFTKNKSLDSKTIVCCDLVVNTYLNKDTVLIKGMASSTDQDNSNFNKLFANFHGKNLVDSATGEVISKDLLESGEFCLNRNYILYFE